MHTLKVIAVAALFGSFSQYLARPSASAGQIQRAPFAETSQPQSPCTQWEVMAIYPYTADVVTFGNSVSVDSGWEPFATVSGYGAPVVMLRHCLD